MQSASPLFIVEDSFLPKSEHGGFSPQPAATLCFNFCPNDGRKFLDDEGSCPLCGISKERVSFSPTTRSTASKPKWRKLLYIKQTYPDNHVDHTFLEEMQKNTNVRSYDYWTVVKESSVITQHVSSIVIFVGAFVEVYCNLLSIINLIVTGTFLTACCYVYWDLNVKRILLPSDAPKYGRFSTIKGTILFIATLLGLTPILKTLTQDTSDDTIWALTFCLFCVNLLFHDYGSSNITNIRYPGSLSTNAAIFSSVLLASRLPSNMHVFGLMLFAVEWFALFPIFRRSVRSTSDTVTSLLTCTLVLISLALLADISKTMLVIYMGSVLFITFVCPAWLIWIQRYKNEIRGPWDEARLVLSSN